ncbi:MAG: hypothetical protein K8S99_09385 [Planctomycetes bacterium]|nr:hypothetical protein [Planctomycetota bacterium]
MDGSARSTPPAAPADRRVWLPLTVAVLAVSCALLFFRLGHYPLWDDEADTALFARSIARTGSANALIDQNLIACRNGAELKDLRLHYLPPAMYYLAAPFVGRYGLGAFWPRFPFAACGLLTVALILFWLRRDGAGAGIWILVSVGIVSNVSLMLYSRECRYYALYQRRSRRLGWRGWLIVAAPQLAAGLLLVVVWNPLGSSLYPTEPGRSLLLDKLTPPPPNNSGACR